CLPPGLNPAPVQKRQAAVSSLVELPPMDPKPIQMLSGCDDLDMQQLGTPNGWCRRRAAHFQLSIRRGFYADLRARRQSGDAIPPFLHRNSLNSGPSFG